MKCPKCGSDDIRYMFVGADQARPGNRVYKYKCAICCVDEDDVDFWDGEADRVP